MKRIFTILCLSLLLTAVWAKHVPQKEAQQFAIKFYRLNNPSGITDPRVQSVTVKSKENVASLYIFRFVSGGFVIVVADNASFPVVGYSFENEMPETIDNPAVTNWLDNYSREIAFIVRNNLDNTETLKEWCSAQNRQTLTPAADVAPLLTTLWDQGCNYNTFCPTDAGGDCGHVYTGCVATAISQILKYHNFPSRGVGQHAYDDGNYGQQSADFANTMYDWASMPNTATSGSTSIATLMHHAGVSMDMGYGYNGSGAQSDYVHNAFLEYFNYSPEIDIKYKDSYANVEDFKALLRADLDANLPIHYAGYGFSGGHDFVCDGYRQSDHKFHFNWGWGGYANGYYTIGNLNPSGYNFNTGDIVTVHIKPYNPNLVVRITNPANKAVISAGKSIEIKAKVIRGAGSVMKIFIDNVQKLTASGDSISFIWSTSNADLGTHEVNAYAMNANDTVYYKTVVNVVNEDEWVLQSSGFPGPRVITYISALDSNIVWSSASNAGNPLWATCSDFSRSTNGGATWKPGVITNTAGLIPAMIFGLDSLKAYVAMFKLSGTNTPGIYSTSDGGTTWSHQASALFANAASWPQVVHFFNVSDGVCIGNPIGGEYEIYTTTNGGTNWTQLPGANIPNPIWAEIGVPGCYSAIHDTIWFGTDMGRVYKSTDKGVHWTVSTAADMAGKFVKPVFRNGSHGLLLDELSGTGLLCETFDGGTTWTQVNYTGPNYSGDLAYVPGTPNTWVRSGFLTGPQGCAYSFDGGHTWTDFFGTAGSPFAQMAWINSHCGWSGGTNTSTTENGIHKFIGMLVPLPSPQNIEATASIYNVDITWTAPDYNPAQMTLQGYNISRNGTQINSSLITTLTYSDQNLTSGQYTYCVSAQYNIGASEGNCKSVEVAVGIAHPDDQPFLMIYPNPAHGKVMVKTSGQSREITVFDQMGHAMPIAGKILSMELTAIDISGLPAGIYLVSVKSSIGISRTKLVLY
jgi:photosystem II stability/assembly factor-like uncharacterized protein